MSRSSSPRFIVIALVAATGAIGALWAVQSRRPRHAAEVQEPATPRSSARGPRLRWEPNSDTAATITGEVRSAAGEAIDGAWVAAARDEEGGGGGELPAITAAMSADGGHFRIEHLPPGRYAVTATAPGSAGAFQGGLVLEPGQELALVLVLEPGGGTLGGRVADRAGAPLPRATVSLMASPAAGGEPGRVYQSVAGDGGAYTINVPFGKYLAVAEARGFAAEAHPVEIGGAAQQINFSLRPAGKLVGRVRTADGAPVGGAEIALARSGDAWTGRRTTTSDERGRFELGDLQPGMYAASARQGRLCGANAAIEIATDAPTNLVLELTEGLTLRGRVRAAAGTPVAGARVAAAGDELPVSVSTVADARGEFAIEGLPAGHFEIDAQARGFVRVEREVSLQPGQTAPLEFVLEPEAIVTGKVLTSTGVPAAGVSVTGAVLAASAPDDTATPGHAWASDRSGPDGAFRLQGLPPGQLVVQANDARWGRTRWGPESLATAGRELILRLQPGGTISGMVRWRRGAPAAAVTVTALATAVMTPISARTDAEGHYELASLPRGPVRVAAFRRDGADAVMAILRAPDQARLLDLDGASARTGVNFVLEEGGQRIAGVALSAQGVPLAEAAIVATPEEALAGAIGTPARATTGRDGQFAFDDLEPGRYLIAGQKAGLPEARLVHVAADGAQVRLQFQTHAALAGVVVDETGRPVTRYQLRLAAERAATMGAESVTVNDPAGLFSREGVAPGTYDLLVTSEEGQHGSVTGLTVASGAQRRDLRVVVHGAVSLRGRVLEAATATPVASATVVLLGTPPAVVRSDADGRFAFHGVAPGRSVQLTISGPDDAYLPQLARAQVGPGDSDAGTFSLARRPGTGAP